MPKIAKLKTMISHKKFQSIFICAIIVLAAFTVSNAYAQQPLGIVNQLNEYQSGMGIVTIKQDPRVEQLLNSYYVQNASKPGMQGFRIRIFFDLGQQSRNNSLEVTNEFMEKFPGVAVYRTFDSPYYKVSVGDYRTRDEALKHLREINKLHPKAFIVPEWINFPGID
jgi:hypothetical protein